MDCVICGKKAKWKSTKYVSPVCSECARGEVNKLLATGEYSPDETATIDFYEPIEKSNDKTIANFNPNTGVITFDVKD